MLKLDAHVSGGFFVIEVGGSPADLRALEQAIRAAATTEPARAERPALGPAGEDGERPPARVLVLPGPSALTTLWASGLLAVAGDDAALSELAAAVRHVAETPAAHRHVEVWDGHDARDAPLGELLIYAEPPSS